MIPITARAAGFWTSNSHYFLNTYGLAITSADPVNTEPNLSWQVQ